METDNLYKVGNVDILKTVEGTTYVYNRKTLSDCQCTTVNELQVLLVRLFFDIHLFLHCGHFGSLKKLHYIKIALV